MVFLAFFRSRGHSTESDKRHLGKIIRADFGLSLFYAVGDRLGSVLRSHVFFYIGQIIIRVDNGSALMKLGHKSPEAIQVFPLKLKALTYAFLKYTIKYD